MSYLICDECNKYYELQPGDKLEDFDLTCECGGSLHADTIKDRNYKPVEDSLDEDKQFMKERELGYKLKPYKPVFRVLKIIIIIFYIVGTLVWLFLFWPIGILGLLGLFGWLARKKK
jgi:hypothetical protein